MRKIQKCLHSDRTPCRCSHGERSSVSRLCRTKTTSKPNPIIPSAKLSVRHCFLGLVRHLQIPLAPLVSVTTGQLHPDFPTTMLAFNLLTSPQLDRLAHHFHQTWPPTSASWQYPAYLSPWIGTPEESDTSLHTKRMRFGSFIGLRDCEMSDIEYNNTYHTRMRGSTLGVRVFRVLQSLEEDWPKLPGHNSNL